MLEADGWFLVRPRGSHRQYKHSVKLGLLTVPGKPGDDLAPGTLNMEETTVLFRPVVENELGRIAESGFRSFPPGLPGQPVFYPVLNEEYATQVARDWSQRIHTRKQDMSNALRLRQSIYHNSLCTRWEGHCTSNIGYLRRNKPSSTRTL